MQDIEERKLDGAVELKGSKWECNVHLLEFARDDMCFWFGRLNTGKIDFPGQLDDLCQVELEDGRSGLARIVGVHGSMLLQEPYGAGVAPENGFVDFVGTSPKLTRRE